MNKNDLSQAFELVLVTSDDGAETQKNLEQIVSDKKGEIVKKESWGKKNFSYQIKKQAYGYYHIWRINLPKNSVLDFKKQLDFTDSLLRYLFLKIDR